MSMLLEKKIIWNYKDLISIWNPLKKLFENLVHRNKQNS